MSQSIDPILATPPPEVTQGLQAPAPSIMQPDSRTTRVQHQHHHHQHGLLPAIQSLFYIIVLAVFIITFIVQPFRIPSGSMEPTLLVGDFLLVDKQSLGFDEPAGILPAAAIHRGEIVIFHYPVDPSLHLIKRVVGLPGDHLRLRDGRVYINGKPLTETYAVYRRTAPDNFRDNFPRLQSTVPDVDPAWWIRMHTLIDHGDLIIPAANYFVLGDNRNDSEDSRYWGFVPRSAIVGSPVFIYFSLAQHDPEQHDPDEPRQSPTHWVDAVLGFARWSRIFHTVH
jgi:signal peptidase I